MKVAIVDDEWFALDITYRLLTLVRHDLETVAFFQDPLEAVEKIPALSPDLIILDVEMPVMNGFELYERLKSLPARFMMITAHGDAVIRQRLADPHVGVLTKPFCKADLDHQLDELFSAPEYLRET